MYITQNVYFITKAAIIKYNVCYLSVYVISFVSFELFMKDDNILDVFVDSYK